VKHFLEPGRTARMQKVTKEPIDVSTAMRELDAQPELWNTVKLRTEAYGTPFNKTDDIWVRMNALKNYNPKKPAKFLAEHHSVWYPAYDKLPAFRPLILGLMPLVAGEELGGVLITRIPAGCRVPPHQDKAWHVTYYNHKFAVMLRANEAQDFCFEGETMKAVTGEIFEFDNNYTHWITNDSDEERITLIVCVHTSEVGGRQKTSGAV
jgi:hypothetical protein